MEVMEEGDLMDRVPVLLVRDRQYYDQHQTILQEIICPAVVGGKLDFPRSASFASVKIVEWWEDEYYAAYKKNSGLLHLNDIVQQEKIIVKSSSPEKFVTIIAKSADKLLEHIHVLSQEALDHADLAVLTATIGASALIKNSLYIYLKSVTVSMQAPKGDESGSSLKLSYKQYTEMTEALAERLLDLHVRLLSLYIIQDADCLHWENPQPFFESERGSYTIQMWWLYMQGTKPDLWSSVPPGMAKRILIGMLNETLTILTVRYSQILPSRARSQLVLVDITNLLLCVSEIMPSVCEKGESIAGFNLTRQDKIIRDIHCKCQELFIVLLLRGIPLGSLYKILRKGPDTIDIFQKRKEQAMPWVQFSMAKLFASDPCNRNAIDMSELGTNAAIALDLKVLLNSPQPNFPLLLKILLIRDSYLTSSIFKHLIQYLPTNDCFKPALSQPFQAQDETEKCQKFLCSKECGGTKAWLENEEDPVGQAIYQWVFALTYIVTISGHSSAIRSSIVGNLDQSNIEGWSDCLDKRQVWNQKRPPWFEAIHYFVYPILDPIVNIMISSIQSGSTVYQTIALTLSCITEMLDCIPLNFFHITNAFNDIITTKVRPLGDAVIIQIIFSALYTKLLQKMEKLNEDECEKFETTKRSGICSVLGEAICAIDEDHKHTDDIQKLCVRASDILGNSSSITNNKKNAHENNPNIKQLDIEFDVGQAEFVPELLLSDVLTTTVGKKSMKLLYDYLKFNAEWLLCKLNISETELSEFQRDPGQNLTIDNSHLLRLMFHIGPRSFDQLLTNAFHINYGEWFKMPMGLSVERAWEQISKRYEFQENSKLSIEDTFMVVFIKAQIQNV